MLSTLPGRARFVELSKQAKELEIHSWEVFEKIVTIDRVGSDFSFRDTAQHLAEARGWSDFWSIEWDETFPILDRILQCERTYRQAWSEIKNVLWYTLVGSELDVPDSTGMPRRLTRLETFLSTGWHKDPDRVALFFESLGNLGFEGASALAESID